MTASDGVTGPQPAELHIDGPSARAEGPSIAQATDSELEHRGLLHGLLRALSPLHVVAAVGLLVASLSVRRTLGDVDSPVHVAVGREILREHRFSDLGSAWLGVPAPSWRTSQWLSEVLMAGGVDAFGWHALVASRLVLLLVLAALLAATLMPRRPAALSVPIFLVMLVVLTGLVQDRPQTLSFVFVLGLGWCGVRLWTHAARPPVLAVAAASLLWAQIHGLWILAPFAFALVAVGASIDRRTTPVVRPALVCAGASLAGLVNPWGPESFLLPLRFRGATSGVIGEWLPTTLTHPFTVAFALLPLVAVVAWLSRPTDEIPRVEILWVLLWTAFGMLAFRNVAVAALLIAPAALNAADRAWGRAARKFTHPSGPREGAALLALALGIVVSGAVYVGASMARTDPWSTLPAVGIADHLAASDRPVRVFNGYNASGVLALRSEGKALLVIDGRADMWGAERITAVTDAPNLGPGWQTTVDSFRPDAFVLPADAPLVQLLVREKSWRVELRDEQDVLLVPNR